MCIFHERFVWIFSIVVISIYIPTNGIGVFEGARGLMKGKSVQWNTGFLFLLAHFGFIVAHF